MLIFDSFEEFSYWYKNLRERLGSMRIEINGTLYQNADEAWDKAG